MAEGWGWPAWPDTDQGLAYGVLLTESRLWIPASAGMTKWGSWGSVGGLTG